MGIILSGENSKIGAVLIEIWCFLSQTVLSIYLPIELCVFTHTPPSAIASTAAV
jgi:hypothetical protein